MLGIFLEVNKNQEITGLRSSRSLSSKSSVGGWPGFVCVLSRFSHVRLFATPGTAACQTPLPMGFCGQECWSGLLHPSPGILLTQGSNPSLLCLLHWQAGSLLSAPPILLNCFWLSPGFWNPLLLSIPPSSHGNLPISETLKFMSHQLYGN